MFSNLLPSDRKYNDIREGWGATGAPGTLDRPFVIEEIPGDSSRTVVVHLMSSFLSQSKNIPLAMVPLVMEIEIGGLDDAFYGTGNNWIITRPRLIADVYTLDTQLSNSFTSHVLQGRSLPFLQSGLYSMMATITSTSQFSLPINSGFTRLSTIYFSFIKDGKETTEFFHPLSQRIGNDPAGALLPVTAELDTFSWNIQCGSERYPQFDCDSVGESFHRLRVAQLIYQGSDSFSISSSQYRENRAIFAMNLERCPGVAGHTVINTRSGSQVTLNFKNLGEAKQIHVVMHYDQVLNVSSAGCEVLD